MLNHTNHHMFFSLMYIRMARRHDSEETQISADMTICVEPDANFRGFSVELRVRWRDSPIGTD